MKMKLYLNKVSDIYAENRLLKFSVTLIALCFVCNSIAVWYAFKYMKVVLVPPVMNSKVEIAGDRASDEYLKAFSRYLAGLVLSYTPHTARGQFNEALTMYSPSATPSARNSFYTLADSIEQNGVTNAFYIKKITADPNKHQIILVGNKKQYILEQKVEDADKTYSIDYEISDGKFAVSKIALVDAAAMQQVQKEKNREAVVGPAVPAAPAQPTATEAPKAGPAAPPPPAPAVKK